MRPVRKKPYQDQTLILRIPLELDDDYLDRNKMERLSWLCLLDEVLRVLPHKPLWESFLFGASSHIHEHHMDGKLKLMISSGWLILNLHTISSFFILLMSWRYTWEITQSSSSRHTYHLIFVNFFLLQPWSQHMVQALPMDNSYTYNLMQTLVYRDFH